MPPSARSRRGTAGSVNRTSDRLLLLPLCDLTLMIGLVPKFDEAEAWLIQVSAFEDAVWLPGAEQTATVARLPRGEPRRADRKRRGERRHGDQESEPHAGDRDAASAPHGPVIETWTRLTCEAAG